MLQVGRRYKIMNPEKMRDAYGKLIYMLQDVSSPQVRPVVRGAVREGGCERGGL